MNAKLSSLIKSIFNMSLGDIFYDADEFDDKEAEKSIDNLQKNIRTLHELDEKLLKFLNESASLQNKMIVENSHTQEDLKNWSNAYSALVAELEGVKVH